MADEQETKNWLLRAAAATGRGLAAGGSFVGQKTVAAYRAVDPDVQRHLVQLPFLAHSLFANSENVIEAQEPDGYRPLIFVHGLGGSKGNFLFMSWMFWLNGRKRSYRLQLDSSTLDAQADDLVTYVEQVKQVTGEQQVDLVAHSMGGLVARIAICEKDMAGSVRTLVTLGAPHRGTFAARYGNTDMVRDLRPDSALMKRLEDKPVPPSVRLFTMWSTGDLLILPSELATLPEAVQIDLSPFTHYSYLLHPKSYEEVSRVLDEGSD